MLAPVDDPIENVFLYDNMIKAELQTEDGFMIVSIKQEPSLTPDVKTEPEDIENYVSHLQSTRPEIKTEQIEVKRNVVYHENDCETMSDPNEDGSLKGTYSIRFIFI